MNRDFVKGAVFAVVGLYVWHHFVGAVPGGKSKAS